MSLIKQKKTALFVQIVVFTRRKKKSVAIAFKKSYNVC